MKSEFDWAKDPLKHFEDFYQEAVHRGLPDPNAMSLATVNSQGQPAVRVVLFKAIQHQGITFYTNYDGHKAQDLATNPKVAANFFWPQMEKQVRVQGQVQKLSRAENEAYFKTRIRNSQIGAWASNQSQEIPNVNYLNLKFQELEKKFLNQEVPCPPHWGGYVIVPSEIEFWFGRQGRMHERYVYQKTNSGWRKFMRAP